MLSLLGQGLVGVLGPGMRPQAARNGRCRCGQAVFFRNSVCLACGAELGFDPEALTLRSRQPGPPPGPWQAADAAAGNGPPPKRCANFGPAGCHCLLPSGQAGAHEGLCRACRLNHTIPDLDEGDNARLWSRIEVAKRRLVSQLLAPGLPVRSKVSEDTEHGGMFDFLRAAPGAPRFQGLVNGWLQITALMHELSRSMGQPDLYPFVLGHHAVAQLHFVHRVVNATAAQER